MNLDSKTVIAVLVLLGSFGLLGAYVLRGEAPPDVILLISAPAIAGVLAYYFGAHNGNITGLTAAATQTANLASALASQALEKRSQPVVAVVTPPAAPASSDP